MLEITSAGVKNCGTHANINRELCRNTAERFSASNLVRHLNTALLSHSPTLSLGRLPWLSAGRNRPILVGKACWGEGHDDGPGGAAARGDPGRRRGRLLAPDRARRARHP